jgi:maltose alpha-D-glucosyltransferase/alpha-amylase
MRRRKKYLAHDEQGEAGDGDLVEICSTRPLSKLKRWRLVRVVRRSALGGTPVTESERETQIADLEIPVPMKTLIGTFLSSAELLGTRTAEMHLALSQHGSDPEFVPESYGTLYHRSVYQSMRNLAMGSLRLVRQRQGTLSAKIRGQTQTLLSQERRILERLEQFRGAKITAQRMRHHGDYHLGQVLFTGKDFRIIDFEGEPARSLADRRRKRCPLRDVAGMIRSFHYAAVSTLLDHTDAGVLRDADLDRLEECSRMWYRWVSAAYLRAYLKAAQGAAFLPRDSREMGMLLDIFLLEKALYDVSYELNNRPDWLRIPLRGILDVLSEEAGR